MIGMHYTLGLDNRWGQAAKDSNCCGDLRFVAVVAAGNFLSA